MLKKILIGAAAILVAIVAVAWFQPADYRVERSITISTPASVPFAMVNDLREWEVWSPWEKLDPQMKKTFEGPPVGVGSSNTWSGNHKVGAGRTTIVESRPDQLVHVRLDFEKPFKDTADVRFAFVREAKGTKVTWSMSGHKNLFSKVICLFMSMDKMIGGDFEKGLAALKAASESSANATV